MEVSNCPECKKALKNALLKGTDPSKLKMTDGHLPGCPTLKPPEPAPPKPEEGSKDETYPWSEAQYKIVPSPIPEPRQGGEDGGGRTGDRPTRHDPAGSAGRSTRTPQPSRAQLPQVGSDRRAKPRGRAAVPGRDHPGGYAAVDAAAKQQIQQFKVVDHANRGEQRDHRKGIWFFVLVIACVLIGLPFPPLMPVFIGAIIMLFLLR